MAPVDLQCREVAFPTSLEQFLMVGTYNQADSLVPNYL